MLDQIFDLQEKLQNRLGYDFDEMSNEERVAYIKEYSLHVYREYGEMMQELPFFKPWSQASNNMTVEEQWLAFARARAEYIDFLHFAINVALALGFTPELLFELYCNKNAENHTRQDEGY